MTGKGLGLNAFPSFFVSLSPFFFFFLHHPCPVSAYGILNIVFFSLSHFLGLKCPLLELYHAVKLPFFIYNCPCMYACLCVRKYVYYVSVWMYVWISVYMWLCCIRIGAAFVITRENFFLYLCEQASGNFVLFYAGKFASGFSAAVLPDLDFLLIYGFIRNFLKKDFWTMAEYTASENSELWVKSIIIIVVENFYSAKLQRVRRQIITCVW